MDIVDLWEGDHEGEHPAFGMNNSWSCTQTTTPDGLDTCISFHCLEETRGDESEDKREPKQVNW